jgi:polysaccharide biosynthesis transport protein
MQPQRALARPDRNHAALATTESLRIAAEQGALEYATFGSLWDLCWRRRKTLACFVAGGLLLGIVLAYTQTPVYQARTSIEIQMPNEDYLNRRQLNPVAEPGTILMQPFLETQVKLMQSDTLLLDVSRKLGLARRNEFKPRPGLRQWVMHAKLKPLTEDGLLEEVRKRLTVRLAGETQIVEILFESSDPKLASDFVNEMATEYREQTLRRMVSSTTQTAELLSGQIQDTKKSLSEAENNLREYVESNRILVGNDKENFADTELKQIQANLNTARDGRIAAQSQYEMVRTASPDDLAKVLDSDTLKKYRVQLTDLRTKLAESLQILKPAHYKVREIQAEIDAVQSAFERERAGILARMQTQYETALFRENALQKEYDGQVSQVAEQMGKSIRYETLKRELDLRRQIYDNMLQKVKDAGVVSAMQASNVRLIDPGTPPDRPVKPKKPLYAAIGLSSGLFAGFLFVFADDRRKLRPAQERPVAEIPLDVPEIGVIPNVAPRRPVAGAGTRRNAEQVTSKALARIDSGGGMPLELTSWRNEGSAAASSFRNLLQPVLLWSRRTGRPRIITVTSACHGDGRTMVICNLAAVMAQTGRSVLLIDGDHINPRLHEIFGLPNDTGFADLIADYSAREEGGSADAVWMTKIPGLYVLPGGRGMGRLATLADDPRTGSLLDRLCRDFDLVLIDTPPVLAGGDACGLARQADGTALVVRPDRTPPKLLEAAIQRLADDGVDVIGKIINDCDATADQPAFSRA